MVILQSLCAGGQNLIVVDGEIERQKAREDGQGKIEIVCVCVWRGFKVNVLFLSYSSVQGACPSSWCNSSSECIQLRLVVGYL